MLEELKKQVYDTNMALVKNGLVVLTWGNASAYDDATGYVVIKPSGVSYDKMQPSDMVVLDLDGKVIEGDLNPSSDTPTHLELYKHWKHEIKAIIHTHSINAVAWAQASKAIPCFGTTHADCFYGSVPITRKLSAEEINQHYELSTGHVILETFQNLEPTAIPGVLVANHGPFCWGKSLTKALESAITLEAVAEMALKTLIVNPNNPVIDKYIQDKHYFRKHGKDAYYGQKN